MRVLENKLQGNSLFSGPTLQAALSDMPHNEAAPALLEISENAERKRRGLLRKAVIVFILWFALFCALKFLPIVYPSPYKIWWQMLGAVWPLFSLLSGRFFSPKKILQTLQNAVAALLICPHEPRFLPHLVDGLQTPKTPEWQSLLYPALTAALWDAKRDDIALRLDATRRASLRAFVAFDFPASLLARSKTQVSTHFDDATTDLTVAAMRTLVTVGDKKTVKVLKRIIRTESDLRNENVVRDAAREFLPVLTAKIAENEEFFRRLRTLASTKTENRYAAIDKYVDTLPQETVTIVLAEYLTEQKQNAARSRIFAAIGLITTVGVVALLYSLLTQKNYVALVGGLSGGLGTVAFSFLSTLRRPDGEMQAGKIAYELAKRSGDDTRLLPVLLHALHPVADKKQSEAVQNAVLHLLPLLRSGDAALVPPQTRRSLRACLTMPRGVLGGAAKNKAIVALNALATIGDTASLRRVQAVTRYANRSPRGEYLRQTAERCLETLKLRKPLA